MFEFFDPSFFNAGILGAVLGGIGSALVGGLVNKSSAKDQMDFQERMSGTAHQREMDDLKKAGLNPILSAKYGGASTPGGASWSAPDVAQSINSAASVPLKKLQKANMEEQNANIQANTALQFSQAKRLDLENNAYSTLSPEMRALILSGSGVSSAVGAVGAGAKMWQNFKKARLIQKRMK